MTISDAAFGCTCGTNSLGTVHRAGLPCYVAPPEPDSDAAVIERVRDVMREVWMSGEEQARAVIAAVRADS